MGIALAGALFLGSVTTTSAAVSYENAATARGTGVNTITIPTFNPGGAGNRVLVVGLTFGLGAPADVTVTYGGEDLTLAPGTLVTRGNVNTQIWYFVAPSITPANIVASWTGLRDVVVGAVAFNGVDQDTPLTNGTSANAATTAVSVTITSAPGDMTMDTVGTVSGAGLFLSAPTQTPRWLDTSRPTVKGGGSTAAGAATVTHAWTAGSAADWTASGVNIKARVIGFEVGSFIKTASAAPATQVIPHGLGQVPKAVILWTEARSDSTFSGTTGITFRAFAEAAATSGTLTLTITKPSGTVQNDVMLASIGVQQNGATITPPTGWTLVRRTNQTAGNDNSLATYWKAAGATEPANYAWTFSASTGSAGGISTFVGVDTLDPIDVQDGDPTASSLTHVAGGVTTTSTNDMLVTAVTMASSASWTLAAMTETVEVASLAVPSAGGQSTAMYYQVQAAPGNTGNRTATASAQADSGNTQMIALKPAYRSYFAFGFSDGTVDGSGSSASQNGTTISAVARRMANKVLTVVKWDQVLLAEADLQSWDATGFTLSWTTNDTSAYIVHYLVMAGSDVTAKVVRWQMPTTLPPGTGAYPIVGVGFQPTAVIHLHTGSGFTATPPASAPNSGFGLGVMDFGGTQWATEMFAANGIGQGDTQRGQQTDAAIFTIDNGLGVTKKASFGSMDADGFTLNFSTVANTNAAQVYSLALLGINVKAGSFLKTTAAAPASQSVTGTGFAPSAVFFHSFQDVTRAAVVTHSRMGYGASDGVTQGTSAFSDLDTADPTDFEAIDKTSKAFMKVNNSTPVIDAEADLTSLDPDGFTVNWTTNDAVATEILYMGLANLLTTEVRLTSFTGAKYPRGALLEWTTGYEIDNLGFNLYREINGVRTKVNTSLIAGSGLQAGRSGVVRASQTYARWDLDAAANHPPVTYWLEDVEFNGKTKLHGPVTLTADTLQDPTTVVADSGDLDEAGAANSRRIFFNYNEDPVHPGPRAVPAQVAPAVTRQWALASQATVKIGIRKPGWYRVNQPELVTAGMNSSVDPLTLQLFLDGTEQAIRVNGASDGTFDPADSIEFYGSGVDTPYTDTRIYWLKAGGQTGRRIAVDGGGSSAPSALTSFSSTLRRRDRSIYFASLRNGDAENWFGPMVDLDPAQTSPPFTLTPGNVAAGPAQVTVALQGVTTAAHHVGVEVNGVPVGEMVFAGQARAEQTFSVSGLIDGANTVTLVARGAGEDRSLVDVIKLDYPHSYQADADRLRFTVVAPASITVGGFASGTIRVYDITDRTAPVELPASVTGAGLMAVTVHVPGTGPRTLMAFSDETVSLPEFVQANQASNLHASTNAGDYVLVSHADFAAEVEPLRALRAQQGYHAVVVDIEDVYDEFSFGQKTPQALRDFLQWARTNWAMAPKFVVLAGDATTDPRDYEALGNADFLPTKQVPMAGVSLETASDDWFVDFDDNGLPQVAIGRLSVRTAAQTETMVTKIRGYDNQTGPLPWTKDVLLVADQSEDAGFEQASNNLGAQLSSGYRANKVYRRALGDAGAQQALTTGVNAGQLIVNYTGHGSVGMWGNGGELLENADVPAWANASNLPFVVAMNCLNGLFSDIWDDSLAEVLHRAPNGGAVAVWASSSLTPAATQALVNQELFRLIFTGTYKTLGEAVVAAKRVVSSQDLRRSWIFFGDPATRLSGAPQASTMSTLGAPPAIVTQPQSAAIAKGQNAALSVVATGLGTLSYRWYSRTNRTSMSPIAGATSSYYTTPPQTSTIVYMVRVSNSSGSVDSGDAVVSTPPTITTSSHWPAATAAASYSLTMTAADGLEPYQWTSTTLPSGLRMDASGEVFNAPNAAGTFRFAVRVTGANGISTEQTFTLAVNAVADVLLAEQWHLKNDNIEVAGADVEPVWPITRGAGVVIGIVDDGVQGTHPDLAANYLPALSLGFGDQDIDPGPLTDGTCETTANCQGTAVAGLAAARGDNGVGGSGVAPLASLASIRLAAGAVDADEAAAFLHKLNGVAIENHSWHRADDGQTLVAPGPLADAALATAIERGRAGAGRIFVWAAGDGRANGDNCNFDGYANSRFGIAVGAVADTSLQASYSESCAALLVSAPSSGGTRSLTTTDLADADGRDPGDATSAFGGTAAAAPVVSGVVALMLARNPALTWRDVQHLLVRTSRQVDPSDPSWTSGVFPHSEKYGFGVVDALAAVQRATRWTTVPAEDRVRAVTRRVGVVIPDQARAGVADTIRIGTEYGGFAVEHVEVEFTAEHPRRGDLEVTLTSPAGVVSHLGTTRAADTGANFLAWRFRSVRHWGESAAGSWTLSVADRAAGSVGIFTGWTLRIYGTATRSGGGGPIVTPALPTAPPVTSAPGAPTRVTAAVGGTAAAAARKPSPAAPRAATAIGPSIAPAAPRTGQAVPVGPVGPVVPVETSSPLGDLASAAAGWNPGIYGTAPQPIESIPPSARPAASPEPAEAEGTVAGGTGAVGPEPLPTPDAGFASEPGAPTDLVASVTGSTIVLKWRTPTSGSTPAGYIVEAGSRAGGSNLFVSRTSGTATSFTTQSAEKGPYFIRVLATNARGTSLPSNEATLVVGNGDSGPCTGAPSAPSGVRLAVSGTSIVATWDAAQFGPTSYVVEMSSGAGGNNLVVSDTGNSATTLTVGSLAPGSYVVRVRARNACGGSGSSETVTTVVSLELR